MSDQLVIAGRAFKSRLIVGTGKYRSFQEMARAHAASGADMVTVAVRRVNLTDKSKESLLDYIDREKMFILPNTAACYSAEEAIRTARLGREVGLSHWVKLEVIGDQQTLFPDTEQLIEATRVLVKEGFVVLPYTNDDLIVARKLVDAGAAAVMPLAAPIGSGLGIQNPANLRILRERITEVPLIVDAGVGTASDAASAMELGADGLLMNTAIAEAEDSVLMAEAMRDATIAGRKAFLAGRMPKTTLRFRFQSSERGCALEYSRLPWVRRTQLPVPIKRLAYIDWMRGLACVLMIQAHCYDSWLNPEARRTLLYRWSQELSTLAAPIFLFLSGVSFALVTEGLRQKNKPRIADF